MPMLPFCRSFFVSGILCLILACMLGGCAGKKPATDPESAKCAAGADSTASVVCAPGEEKLDSLRAKFVLNLVDDKGKEQSLDAVLFSVPGKRYRMEMTGPMGIGVASMLWTDEGWTMVFPTEKLYMKGRGYMVGLFGDVSIPMVNIHQVAGFFNGDYVPPGTKVEQERNSAGVKIVDAVDALGMKVSYAVADGQVQWITRRGRDGKTEMLKFMGYRPFEGRVLAERVLFERDGAKFLEMRLKKVTHGKSFSFGTWRLNVPRSYKAVGE